MNERNNLTLCELFASLLMLFCVTACSDDNGGVTVVFPEKQTITEKASDTEFHELTFNADFDWTLTSNAAWCYFVSQQDATPDSKERTLSGKAGKQTVKIGISDEGQDFEKEDVATITIVMNGQESVLAEVTRSMKERELKVYKKTGDDGSWVEIGKDEAIVAGYEEENTYMVKANFAFAATSLPEWLEEKAITGDADKEVEFGIQAKNDKPEYYKNPNEGTIIFKDQKNENVTFSCNVSYEGMDPRKIVIETSYPQYQWEVSMDGQTFTNLPVDGGSSEPITVEQALEGWTIIARNDEYEMVFIEKTEVGGYPYFRTNFSSESGAVNWIHADKLMGNKIKITVDPAEKEREGFVLAFPEAVYEEIKTGDPYANLIEGAGGDKDVKYEYLQNNLLINFIQKNTQSGDVTIVSQYWENYGETVKLGSESELDKAIPGIVEFLKSEYSATALYTVNAADCSSVRIYVPFEVTSLDQFSARYMPKPPTYGDSLPEGSNGNIGLPEDSETKAVDLWQIQGSTDMLLVNIHDEMHAKSIVIVVLPPQK